PKKYLGLMVLVLLLVGFAISSLWQNLHNPMKPLYVELVNATELLIPSVIIEHGSAGLQEKITLVQLKSKESRVLALNHKPGMGFNVLVNFSDGTKTEICGGKSKDHWFFRETITKFGIYTTPVR
ncbi:MAG: hypothetical protein KAI17_01535, partial [Thiotrichaceae bacterium]|nr:hypothetical protein [Thiotrichaceae bacterium]